MTFETEYPELIEVGIKSGDGLVFSQVQIADRCRSNQRIKEAVEKHKQYPLDKYTREELLDSILKELRLE